MTPPDFSSLSLPELRAWQAALRGAIAVAHGLGGGEVAILADADGVSVTFTVFPQSCDPKGASNDV